MRRRISLVTIAFVISLGLVLEVSAAGAAEIENKSGNASTNRINRLLESPGITVPRAVLKDFIENRSASTRVIVNLRETETVDARNRSMQPNNRERVANRVHELLERVLGVFNPTQVETTHRFKYMAGFSAQVTLEGLEALVENPDVLSIEEDRLLYPNLAQGIPLMNATTARSSYNGAGLSVAICDTGIDYTHARLGNGGFPNSKVIGGYDTGDGDNDPMDLNGHGTACAGIAAGDLGFDGDYIGGVAHNARLYALKISHGSGGSAYNSSMIEAWEWCITHQHDDVGNPIMVINTSFGGGRSSGYCDASSVAMTRAAANAKAVGMTLFVSSGNDGYCDAIGWPACISHVISVGAVYDAPFTETVLGWCVAESSCAEKYSSGGCPSGYYSPDTPKADAVAVYSDTASFLSLLAPSNWATTTKMGGGYWTAAYGFSGTSAACPYAAGAAACLQDAAKAINGAFLTPDQVQSVLTSTGDLVTDAKVAITKPRVNLGQAVASLQGGGLMAYVEPAGVCGGKSPCYTGIQSAINAVGSGATVKISWDAYAQALTLNTAKALTIRGGWDSAFTTQTSNTTVTSLTIEKGSVVVEQLILQ
ncbi:MAG: S8 family serine peptidase [Deltaproteobacteria bacterium]|nr:S8 family serine peptidase [Deltaproteobacteria bacterium]